MKNLAVIFFSLIGVVVLFFIYMTSNGTGFSNVKLQDRSIKDEISKIVDSIDLYMDNNDVKHSIACGDKGSWSDFTNDNNELLKTESEFLISRGILFTSKYYKSENTIFAEIVFADRTDTLFWEDRYFNDRGFYSDIKKGSLNELSKEVSKRIKKYHYKLD